MKTLSLYQEGHNLIYKIDPLTKALFVLVAILCAYLMPSPIAVLSELIILLAILVYSGAFRRSLALMALSLVFIVTIFIIQGIFSPSNQTPLFSFGFITFYQEGVTFALQTAMRILIIITSFAVFIFTTKPSSLVQALQKKGFSPRFGYVILSVFQIIPQMMSTVDTITDAQRSRGMEMEGSLLQRIKSFLPLIGPVIMSSLTNTRERSLALEARGFSSKADRTYVVEESYPKWNTALRVILIVLVIAALVWRIFG
jgi:energy-coupling factor transport system permease protein